MVGELISAVTKYFLGLILFHVKIFSTRYKQFSFYANIEHIGIKKAKAGKPYFFLQNGRFCTQNSGAKVLGKKEKPSVVQDLREPGGF